MDLIQIPVNSGFLISTLVVFDELGTDISLGIDRVLWKSREPVLHRWGQDNWQVVRHGVLTASCCPDCRGVDPEPCLRVSFPIIGLDAFWAEAARPVDVTQSGCVGPNAIEAEWWRSR